MRVGDAAAARAAFEAAVAEKECGLTLSGLAGALHMESDYSRASRALDVEGNPESVTVLGNVVNLCEQLAPAP